MQGVQQIETLGTQAKQQQYPRRQPCRHSLHSAARRHDNGGRALPPPVPGIHGGHLLRQLRWRWHPAGNAAPAGQLLLTELRLQPGRRARPRGGRAPQRRGCNAAIAMDPRPAVGLKGSQHGRSR
jgi:hypothetical protein